MKKLLFLSLLTAATALADDATFTGEIGRCLGANPYPLNCYSHSPQCPSAWYMWTSQFGIDDWNEITNGDRSCASLLIYKLSFTNSP